MENVMVAWFGFLHRTMRQNNVGVICLLGKTKVFDRCILFHISL